jgi:hypothetical protein
MTNILDGVEPDCWRWMSGDKWVYGDARPVIGAHTASQMYSRETVERLLEAHRKQIAEEFAVAAWTVGMNEHNKALGMPCDAREVGSAVARELRRMAEGEK